MATSNAYANVRAEDGYRSGFEKKLHTEVLEQYNGDATAVAYEPYVLPYEVPAKTSKYTPDFVLWNGIHIESKGRLTADDRRKHLLLKKQYPDLDLRFVFEKAHRPLYKGAKSTYADWCKRNGFLFAERHVPTDWLFEKPKNTQQQRSKSNA